ncbi:FMRFamide receptor-like [Plakobranchus ocellatus]|uniref:FMRFamide receptor-like n=1 Tax=Plakobranchus ocellatus TaxID=259542 RepID=A0AAV4DGR2_9GAST|nr:FMRFamide receptor-like [Plakobranchus ocellatus]
MDFSTPAINSSSSQSSSPLSSSLLSLNDTWEYFISLSDKEKLQLMEQLRSMGISEEDLHFLYSHLDLGGDDLRFLHIPEFRAHKILMLWIPPVLLFLGTMGNTCSFAVLRQKTMRQQSIYIYLCALAVFDSLVLYVGLLRLWLGEITGVDIRNSSSWLCKGTLMLGYTCSDISVWLIVAVTVER